MKPIYDSHVEVREPNIKVINDYLPHFPQQLDYSHYSSEKNIKKSTVCATPYLISNLPPQKALCTKLYNILILRRCGCLKIEETSGGKTCRTC